MRAGCTAVDAVGKVVLEGARPGTRPASVYPLAKPSHFHLAASLPGTGCIAHGQSTLWLLCSVFWTTVASLVSSYLSLDPRK